MEQRGGIMKVVWMAMALVTAAASMASAQTNDSPVRAPRAYTNRVQMYNVPLQAPETARYKAPDVDAGKDAFSPLHAPRLDSLDEAILPPPPPPVNPRVEQQGDKKKDWILQSPTELILGKDPEKKDEKSGWGWLADEVRRKETDARAASEKAANEEEEDRDGANASAEPTNRSANALEERSDALLEKQEYKPIAGDAASEEEMVRRAVQSAMATGVESALVGATAKKADDPFLRRSDDVAPTDPDAPDLTSWKTPDFAPRWNDWRDSAIGADAVAAAGDRSETTASRRDDTGSSSFDTQNRDTVRGEDAATYRRSSDTSGLLGGGDAGRTSQDQTGSDRTGGDAAGGMGWWAGARSPWSGDNSAGSFQPFSIQPTTSGESTPTATALPGNDNRFNDLGGASSLRTTPLPW